MDPRCESISELLGRVVEGEATPEESYRVARHLPQCTPCRILLARERRLAEALDGLADVHTDDPGFLDRVMSSLGKRPVPNRAEATSRRPRRGLRLAGFALGLPALEWIRQMNFALRWEGVSWTLAAPAAENWPELLGHLANTAAAALAVLGGNHLPVPGLLGPSAILGAAILAITAAGIALAGTAVALAAAVPRRLR